MAQDKATQETLLQALQAGVLLDRSVDEFKGRTINAEWLLGLLAPNPTRDLLLWMNVPDAARQHEWSDCCGTCSPSAARWILALTLWPMACWRLLETGLAKAEGKWAAVAELYRDSYSKFSRHLRAAGQGAARREWACSRTKACWWGSASQRARRIRSALCLVGLRQHDGAPSLCSGVSGEKKHGSAPRVVVGKYWAFPPLAQALGHLALVAERSSLLPMGQTPADLAAGYQQSGWQVDQAALHALACVHTKADLETVGAALRAMYLPWVEEAARRLQEATKATGGLPPLPTEQPSGLGAGTCTVFVDGLRYDVAVQLQQRLLSLGDTALSARWTSLPSVTASGKAWCSPVAAHIAGTVVDAEFEPERPADGQTVVGLQLAQAADGPRRSGRWTSTRPATRKARPGPKRGDLDHYGHEHGLRLARDLRPSWIRWSNGFKSWPMRAGSAFAS